jgi:aryl-alcohol dehydrogenase-like predicted oxidoreductase
MGRVGRAQALRALASAFDHGIDYFDVARSYGYGNAERVLGEFLRGRRDRCLVATKVGIAPALPGLLNRAILPVARSVVSFLPTLQRLSSRRGRALAGVSSGRFQVDQVRGSVETSLRELRLDHVDVLLLHEVRSQDFESEELLRALEDIVQSGKARALGSATAVEESREILSRGLGLPVVQVPSHLGAPASAGLPSDKNVFLVTHSALGMQAPDRQQLAAWLLQRPDRLAALASSGLEIADPSAAMPELLLSWALAANPDGVVLCGMMNPKHLEVNLRCAEQGVPCREAVLALGEAWRSGA